MAHPLHRPKLAVRALAGCFVTALVFGLAMSAWALTKLYLIPHWRDLPRAESNDLVFQALADTEYSPSFSESKFSRIHLGMQREEVLDLLGNPIRIIESHRGRIVSLADFAEGEWSKRYPDLPADPKIQPDDITYFYSIPGRRSDHWYVRAVSFSREGTVTDVASSFYVD